MPTIKSNSISSPGHEPRPRPYAFWLLAALAIAYALLANLHTLQDFDLGWQLATGRWVLQHHRIFSTDVFSYTAHGQPWIYPVLSGIVFYLVSLAGGYALLTWLGALACAGTIALLLQRRAMATAALALIAIPLVANRTQPRAEMFTTLLFAAFLALLWRHHRGERAHLWLLPVLMIAWVNLHLGFVAGLGLCAAYVLLEVFALAFSQDRTGARNRLRSAWPWLALTAAATLVNPWGPRIYGAIARQARAQDFHTLWLVEWESARPSWGSLRQALDWRDPQSSFWWLLFAAAACVALALWRKRFGAAALLAGSGWLAMQHVRSQALFACVVVVIGGSILHDVTSLKSTAWEKRRTVAVLTVTSILTVLVGVRGWDLISDRYYMKSAQLANFGTGLSWWFPERAVDFLKHEKLPGNIFNAYNLGGYLTWRLGPEYPDYIDGRAIPFGKELFFRAYDLSVEPPDSRAWREETAARGINTILVSLGRYQGVTLFPQLQAFCHSQSWTPVYLDEVSGVFVRRTADTASQTDRLRIDCDKAAVGPSNTSSRTKPELFTSWANAGGVLYGLGRYPEALSYLDRAQTISAGNANLHLTRALVLEHLNRPAEAEDEFRASIQLESSDETSLDLGLFYMTQKRYSDAAQIFLRAAETSPRPHDLWMLLGQADLQIGQPQPALAAFDKAEASSPFRNGGESLGAGFNSLVATGRAKAWYQLGDLSRAVSFQEDAVNFAPNDAKLWLGLADLYDAQGRTAEAREARGRADVR